MTTILEAEGISIAGRLMPTDLALAAGSVTMLVGPNGAGKTSLLHALARIAPARGRVEVLGIDLAPLSGPGRTRLLHFAPASRELHWPLAARDVVRLGLADRAPEQVEAALEDVDAAAFAERRADRLSTGERARLMLARALLAAPAALLLDEPIANLDPLWQLRTLALLRREASRGSAVLASIHDLALAQAHADRILLIDRGRIVADGSPDEAMAAPKVSEVFGVRRGAAGWEAVA